MNDPARRLRIAAMFAAAIAIAVVALVVQASHRHHSTAAIVADANVLGTTTKATTTVPPKPTVRPTTTLAATSTTLRPSTTTKATPRSTSPPATTPRPAPTVAVAAAPQGDVAAGLGAVRGRTIVIDAGHNGGNGAHANEIARPIFIGTMTRACDTTGTETNGGYTESAYNLDVALRLRDVLAAAGANVVMVRTTNDGWGPCIDERAAIGNRAHAAAAISIHADGGPAGGRGFHVLTPAFIPGYTDDIYGASKRLGTDVRDAFRATGMPTSTYIGVNGIVERSDLGGLNLSNVPKVFIETGNMRNSTDAALLTSSDFREREAQALAQGLAAYLAGR